MRWIHIAATGGGEIGTEHVNSVWILGAFGLAQSSVDGPEHPRYFAARRRFLTIGQFEVVVVVMYTHFPCSKGQDCACGGESGSGDPRLVKFRGAKKYGNRTKTSFLLPLYSCILSIFRLCTHYLLVFKRFSI